MTEVTGVAGWILGLLMMVVVSVARRRERYADGKLVGTQFEKEAAADSRRHIAGRYERAQCQAAKYDGTDSPGA